MGTGSWIGQPSRGHLEHLFQFLTNEHEARLLLTESYRRFETAVEAKRLAYENTLKWIYALKQGLIYFREAERCTLMVKPLLLFYGITSFKKGLILLYDPAYPKTTTVLQHGLTTRKKKRIEYRVSTDEVKVQKDGLLPHFSKQVLGMPLVINEKYQVKQLWGQCPELQEGYQLLFGQRTFSPLGQGGAIKGSGNQVPLIREDVDGQQHRYTGKAPVLLDELIIYHMVMYILSMLCRYDTETWGEILFSFASRELFLIDQFLGLVWRKYPGLILRHLKERELLPS